MIDVEVLHSISAIGTQILLTHKDRHVIVDAGDGTVRDLTSKNVDFSKIDGVLLTHEHFDHLSGLYALLHFFRLLQRKEPLTMVVPKPSQIVPLMLKSPLMCETLPFEVRLKELSDGESVSVGQLGATAFVVQHRSANAFGYSIQDDEGFRVVISGDSISCESLAHHVRGADIAVLDATYVDGSEDLASKYGHMTRSQALGLGKNAKRTILIHSNPENYFQKFQCSKIQSPVACDVK